LLLQGDDLPARLGFGEQPGLLLDLDRLLGVAQPLGDEPPLAFQLGEVGLRGADRDEPVDQRDARGVISAARRARRSR
jgi:hypothetical protein